MPLILYAIIAAHQRVPVTMEDLFIGGLVPGLLMLGLVALFGVREGRRAATGTVTFSGREAVGALWAAKWEVLLPIVVLGSLFSGVGTVESAALAAAYALVVQRFVHRDIPSVSAVVKVTGKAVALIGGVMVILAVASGLTDYLVAERVPDRLVAWTEANVESRVLFLLALNVFLLGVGAVMDIFSAIIVVVPLIVPVADFFGIHPVHLGILFIANLELGYLTPPVGLNLFLSSYRFNRPVLEVARATLPMLLILAIGVLLITYVDWLTLGLLSWLWRG
jgi:tripartite ATP-independent transporter DctM subunit